MIFFTIDTINDGLSYDGKKSPFSLNFHWSVPYTIFRNHGFLDKASWSDQRARLAREYSHSKEHLKLCRIVFSKVCNIVFLYRKFSLFLSENLCLKKLVILSIFKILLQKLYVLGKVILYSDSPWNSLQIYV